MTAKPFVTIGIRFSEDELEILDMWREDQGIVPSRSASVRYLVLQALRAVAKEEAENG